MAEQRPRRYRHGLACACLLAPAAVPGQSQDLVHAVRSIDDLRGFTAHHLGALAVPWSVPEDAVGRRPQIGADRRFAELAAGRFRPDAPPAPGACFRRVAVRADSAEQGPFSNPPGFAPRPPPSKPRVVEPEIDDSAPTLRWQPGDREQACPFQLACDPEFARPLADRTLAPTQVRVARVAGQTRCLRIRTIDCDGYTGLFGTARRVDPPPAPLWPSLFFPVAILLVL